MKKVTTKGMLLLILLFLAGIVQVHTSTGNCFENTIRDQSSKISIV